jgi:hypothetical protein
MTDDIIIIMEWISDKYDFSDPDVRLDFVPEMGCSVGGCMSALKRSWKSYKAARREGYADRCLELEYRINSIQAALGIEECSFGIVVPVAIIKD